MRQVVMLDDLRELEIWPSDLFDKYLEITKTEVERLLTDSNNLIDVSCPACDSNDKKFAFKKFDLNYMECNNCKSLYVSPRPAEENIRKYFTESKAVEFCILILLKKR